MFGEAIKVEAQVDRDKRIVMAYAAIFGNRDVQGHRVREGAFRKSIDERLPNGQIKVFRDHERLIGRPLVLREDERGLYTESAISRTALGDETLELIKDGTLTHFSFRADIIRAVVVKEALVEDDPEPTETLELIELRLKEFGPVDLLPANPLASILGTKSAGAALDTLVELPEALKSLGRRRGARLSTEERKFAEQVVTALERMPAIGEQLKALLAPEAGTPPHQAAPPLTTPAEAVDEAELLHALAAVAKHRAQLFQSTTT